MLFCYLLIFFLFFFEKQLFQIQSGILSVSNSEACIAVLGIQDICHFTSRDIGYYPFYFQGHGILGSKFSLLPGMLKI